MYDIILDKDDEKYESLPEYIKKCLAISEPFYNGWGNGCDYMRKNNAQWNSDVELDSIDDMWELNELNEVVNFYFRAERKVKECPLCNGCGLSQKSIIERDNFHYDKNNLTETDLDALNKDGWFRYYGGKPESLSDLLNNKKFNDFNIDSLRLYTILKDRAKLGGYNYTCSECKGEGELPVESEYHLALQLWHIFPRKSASCGVLIHNIKESDLPKVFSLLNTARERFNQKLNRIEMLREVEEWQNEQKSKDTEVSKNTDSYKVVKL